MSCEGLHGMRPCVIGVWWSNHEFSIGWHLKRENILFPIIRRYRRNGYERMDSGND